MPPAGIFPDEGQRGPQGLADFAGDWALKRHIEDRRAGQRLRFEGIARLVPAAEGLHYAEAGRLHLPGQGALAASRSYRWEQAGARIRVRFADGRAFHAFDPRAPEPEATHPCGADLYRVRYDFAAWPAWTALWQVTGPRKDLVLLGRYAPRE